MKACKYCHNLLKEHTVVRTECLMWYSELFVGRKNYVQVGGIVLSWNGTTWYGINWNIRKPHLNLLELESTAVSMFALIWLMGEGNRVKFVIFLQQI